MNFKKKIIFIIIFLNHKNNFSSKSLLTKEPINKTEKTEPKKNNNSQYKEKAINNIEKKAIKGSLKKVVSKVLKEKRAKSPGPTTAISQTSANVASMATPFIIDSIKKQKKNASVLKKQIENKNITDATKTSAKIVGDVLYRSSKSLLKGSYEAINEKNTENSKKLKEAVGSTAIGTIPGVGAVLNTTLDNEAKEGIGNQIIADGTKNLKTAKEFIGTILDQNKSKEDKAKKIFNTIKDRGINSLTDMQQSALNIADIGLNGVSRTTKKVKDSLEKNIGKDNTNKLLLGAVLGPSSILLSREDKNKIANNIYDTATSSKKTADSLINASKNGIDVFNKLARLKNPKEEFKKMTNSTKETIKNTGSIAKNTGKFAFNVTKGVGKGMLKFVKNPKKMVKETAKSIKAAFSKIKNAFKILRMLNKLRKLKKKLKKNNPKKKKL
jgi:hypothetical protein